MADLFLADESSTQSSLPCELIDIVLPTVTYRIACGERDVKLGSALYTATPAARSELVTADGSASGTKELTITLPVTHPVVKRWFRAGVPPRQVVVTLQRQQARSGLSEQVWAGLVTSIRCDGSLAKLNVPARTIDPLQRSLPTLGVSRTCPHVLYDPACKADRASFVVSVAAIYVVGADVRVSLGSTARNGDWAESGELLHVATGERMTIAKQADIDPGVSDVATLTMQSVIPELKTGDAVMIYAGCKKSIGVCQTKFANRRNFGGLPALPTVNPFISSGRGIVATPGE